MLLLGNAICLRIWGLFNPIAFIKGGARMKKMKEEKRKMKKDLEVGGVEWYRRKIVDMIGQVENIKFLNQIFTILKKHINIKKRGD